MGGGGGCRRCFKNSTEIIAEVCAWGALLLSLGEVDEDLLET